MANYTDGPWGLSHRTLTGVEGPNGRYVCSTGGYQDGSENSHLENEANAVLIAAAVPEMYEALEKAEIMLRSRGHVEMANEARQALDKAKGQE